MLKTSRVLAFLVLAAGSLLGYLAASEACWLGASPAAGRREDAGDGKPIARVDGVPHADPRFEGVADRTLAGSRPDFPKPVKAPAGAPNVLLILVDDACFGNPSTFGGPCQTPTLSKLAAQGLRYNRFHVTALCSLTRAALLSGRNHHAVGFGSIAEFSGGWPGHNATWPKSAASIAQILQGNGYTTAAFGKWHLTPDDQRGAASRFDRWPNGLGFDYFSKNGLGARLCLELS